VNRELLKANTLPAVPVKLPCDEFDNLIRTWGVGFCCEYFGHEYDGKFAEETAAILQERYKEAVGRAE
jgi:hypothetical protein